MTTYEDPRCVEMSLEENEQVASLSKERTVHLIRDPIVGFGFVAGSEKPVVVRFVNDGGPSHQKLLPGDQILKINGENVMDSPRDYVIQLVRSCTHSATFLVRQPGCDNNGIKSALLSSAKKARLKSNPSRVRFADGIQVNGESNNFAISSGETSISPMPNVLKVFLENGQTKSFKYDHTTKVKDVLASLRTKLCLKSVHHFALVLEQMKSLRKNTLITLSSEEFISKIANRPGSQNLRCLFRVVYYPRDTCEFAQLDLNSFEYLYLQSCNDIVEERYAPEVKYDTALRLAALHIHQHAISNNIPFNKITVKLIERQFGLEKFVPHSLISSMKRKELRKLLTHLLKLNQTITGTTHKTLTSLQAKLYYLSIVSELPSYGAKCFSTSIKDCNVETVILISPRLGICQVVGARNNLPLPITDIEDVGGVRVESTEDESEWGWSAVTLYVPALMQKELRLVMEDREAEEMVLQLQGYWRILAGQELPIIINKDLWTPALQDTVPYYYSLHTVLPDTWSYSDGTPDCDQTRYVDFSVPPPAANNRPKNEKQSDYSEREKVEINSSLSIGNGTMKRGLSMDHYGYGVSQNKNKSDDKSEIDFQSVLSMEILENEINFEDSRKEDVLKRVAEMHSLIENSEQYLTEHHQRDSSDSDTSHISSLDSDSTAPCDNLLCDAATIQQLDFQIQKEECNRLYEEAMQSLQFEDDTESECDTDSLYTPNTSPPRKQNAISKDSALSFGLHSPDNIPNDEKYSMRQFWKAISDSQNYASNNGDCFYAEQDLIDLTTIPPPEPASSQIVIENGVKNMCVPAEPPKNFTDNPLTVTHTSNDNEVTTHDIILDSVLANTLNADKFLNLDLDSFLASMAIRAPSPTLLSSANTLTSEQISSYIIPPPPSKERSKIEEFDLKIIENEETIPKIVLEDQRTDESRKIDQSEKSAETPKVNGNTSNSDSNNNNGSNGVRLREGVRPKIPQRRDSLTSLSRDKRSPQMSQSTEQTSESNHRKLVIDESRTSVSTLLEELKQIQERCSIAQDKGGGSDINEPKFQDAIREITYETRQLVSMSKLLFRSSICVEPEHDFAQNMNSCLRALRSLVLLSGRLCAHTASPLQTRNLVNKVYDVANAFCMFLLLETFSPQVVTSHAECLANMLATLLRSLRIFSP